MIKWPNEHFKFVIILGYENPAKLFSLSNECPGIFCNHTSLEASVGQKKELLIPPIWGCCGPTRASFFTHSQIKHPASSEIAVKTHSRFGPHLADHFACVTPALKKGWMFYLPMIKKWTLSRSTTITDRWYRKFFFFGQLALPMMCVLYVLILVFCLDQTC